MFKVFWIIFVILVIIDDMKCFCLDVWLVNFINLVGMVMEVVIKYGGWKKIVGLCNVLIGYRK